ncbi:carbon-nitrogen hydrolase [Trametes sanguinea]|nr:carbon-nitrogen hydrolase [Trametes sanguinea]
MRVAVVQFAPKIGQVQDNIRRAESLCERLKPNSVDLVCLPEMIFTGYVFPDAASISPYLEDPRTGPTSRFCASLAARLHCYILAGYPERLPPDEVEHDVQLEDGRTAERIGANSAVLYGPDGQWLGGYRKTNLYETDMTWAKPGTGFQTFHLPPPLGPLSLGICMDLNAQPPAVWSDLVSGPYEVAEYCIQQRTRVLVLLNAWLDSRTGKDGKGLVAHPEDGEDADEETDWRTIEYWAMRLRPLWAKVVQEGKELDGRDASEQAQAQDGDGRNPDEELLVVICNRSGTENGITFAGSSALFSLTRNSGRPRLLRVMKRRQEGLEVWTYPSEGSKAI